MRDRYVLVHGGMQQDRRPAKVYELRKNLGKWSPYNIISRSYALDSVADK
jgi:hypothetical protein